MPHLFIIFFGKYGASYGSPSCYTENAHDQNHNFHLPAILFPSIKKTAEASP
jgi:hypothetical protein